jgi:predicted AlkP superfamily phosphohydrolase/phosphomutase
MYIGPGAGFAFLGSFLTLVLSVLAAVASFLIWPFRMLWLALRRKRGLGAARVRKLIFLGLDGLDPVLTERFMAEGKLPNLAKLHYRRLRTTCPALSPVAWSTFATGVNPARHNIFDFLNRDLRSYAPEISSAKVRRDSVEFRRKSEPFWKILGRHDIRSTILRVPISFPPEPFAGRMLSAMATPDLRGTQGTFSRFTAENLTQSEGAWSGQLKGQEQRTVGFTMRASGLEIQGQKHTLRVGEYTPWIRLRFGPARGIVRFLLTRTEPTPELYATPVEIDPARPALPISHPSYYALYLAKLIGTFATLGMAEDTWALNEGAIGHAAFLDQAKSIQAEREAMFFSALEHTRQGVVACVFDTTDRVQHMCWKQPAVIEDLYRDMDRVVGQALAHVNASTAFFVLSDHGFCGFDRCVNLNAWLEREGYLTHTNGEIDYTRTRAYALGLSGLYLNIAGRESQGVVLREEAPALRAELIAKLTQLRDGDTIAMPHVYAAADIYRGPYLDAAPDLIVGYARGYRVSWSTAAGKVEGAQTFEQNEKAWCGDHCVDPELVPGVLFSNLPIDAADPGIEDMAPTALSLFGVAAPAWMEGKAVA